MRVNSEIDSVDKETHFHQKNHYLHAVPQKGSYYLLIFLLNFTLYSFIRLVRNSTFSWWGAWLNPNMDKTVIVPSRWFQHSEAPDIYPTGWIKVPVS